jgi:glycosyltransferase involved in cell wall biosynthesis
MGESVRAASVVIVNYNYERYLGDAIDSALDQGDSVEVIVVDDGSTDGSADLIRSYGDRVVPVLQANAGQGAAFTAGFAATNGDIVCFLDADDLLLPGTIMDALALYEAGPYAKLHWPLMEVDEAGEPLGGVNPPVELPAGDLSDLVVERGPGAYPTPPSSGNAYSRPFLDQVMPVPDLRVCADVYLYDLAPLYGPVARLDRPGGALRFHDSSNFMARRYDDRLPHSVRVHELTIPKMVERCRQIGRQADEAAWQERSWPLRSQRALDEIDDVIPPSTPFVLVDGGRIGVEPTPRRPLVRVAEDGSRLADLLQHDFLVVAWPSFSWLDSRPDLRADIGQSYRPVLDNPRVRIYVRAGDQSRASARRQPSS